MLQLQSLGLIDFDDTIPNGFIDVWGVPTTLHCSPTIPDLSYPQSIEDSNMNPLDNNTEILLIDSNRDPVLRELEEAAKIAVSRAMQEVSQIEDNNSSYSIPGRVRIGFVAAKTLAEFVCKRLELVPSVAIWNAAISAGNRGSTAFNGLNETKLMSKRPTPILLGEMFAGLQRHRCILFKHLSGCLLSSISPHFRSRPLRVRYLKGKIYCGDEDHAMVICKCDDDTEFAIDFEDNSVAHFHSCDYEMSIVNERRATLARDTFADYDQSCGTQGTIGIGLSEVPNVSANTQCKVKEQSPSNTENTFTVRAGVSRPSSESSGSNNSRAIDGNETDIALVDSTVDCDSNTTSRPGTKSQAECLKECNKGSPVDNDDDSRSKSDTINYTDSNSNEWFNANFGRPLSFYDENESTDSHLETSNAEFENVVFQLIKSDGVDESVARDAVTALMYTTLAPHSSNANLRTSEWTLRHRASLIIRLIALSSHLLNVHESLLLLHDNSWSIEDGQHVPNRSSH